MLYRLPVRLRLIALSVTLLAMTVGTNVYLSQALDRASEATQRSDALAAEIATAQAVRSAFADLRYWMTDLAVSLLSLSEANADAARDRLQANLISLGALEPAIASRLQVEARLFDETVQRAVDAYTSDQRVIGNSLLAKARGHGLQVEGLLDTLDDDLRLRASATRNLVMARTAEATRVSSFVVAAAVVLATTLTVLVLRSILNPLRRLVVATEAVSRGDLDVALPPPGSDEMGAMARALALFRESQRERQRLSAEAETQRRTLADAISSFQEGFVLYDRDERLLMHNENYLDLHEGLRQVTAIGARFEDILRASIDRGIIDLGDQSADEWIAT